MAEVPFQDGMKIGLGYNRLTGEISPDPAVSVPSVTSVQGAVGQRATTDCLTINDVETLHKSLGVSVDAGGSYMGFSANVKVDYINNCDFSSFSHYVLVKVSVRDAFESVDSPQFVDDATELIRNNNPIRFRERFGDTFVNGIAKGGEYFAIFQITGSDESERESIAGKVHAAYNGGITSAELNVSINSAKERSKSHLETRVHVYREGAIREADLNIEDIMKTARAFPVDVSAERAFPYAVSIQEYKGLRSPNDAFNYIEIQNQQDVLADLAKKRFEFLTLRNDFSYILKHVEDFQNADGSAADRAAVAALQVKVVEAINTMEHEAAMCARDAQKCNFTAFEVGSFPKPVLKPGHALPQFVPEVVGHSLARAFDMIEGTGIVGFEPIDADANGSWQTLSVWDSLTKTAGWRQRLTRMTNSKS